MCGGCGGGGGRDWASAAVAGPAARAVAAVTATALCRALGEPTRVAVSPSGWLVSSPTGATTVAATLTALWAAVPALAGRAAAVGIPGLDQLTGPGSAAAGPSERTGLGGAPGRRVAVLVGEVCGPEGAWADSVVDAVDGGDPAAVVAGVDGADAGMRVLVRCPSDAAAAGALAALAAPGPAQRSTVVAVVARGRAGHPWADDLDQLGARSALEVLEGAVPAGGHRAAGRVVRSPGSHPAAAACWGAAALAAGRAAGRRTRLVVDGDRVVVDLLDRSAVALRPLP